MWRELADKYLILRTRIMLEFIAIKDAVNIRDDINLIAD
jgi:hypothetical protein